MIEIDFEALKLADFEVINSRPTVEEFREVSSFLKSTEKNKLVSKRWQSFSVFGR